MIRRIAPIFFTALLLTVALASVARAEGKPLRVFLPAFTGVFEGFCPFPVDVEVPVENVYMTTFFDTQGNPVRAVVTGHLVGSFTNTETGATLVRQTSGPVFINYHSDGSVTVVASGISALFLFSTDPGGPAILITAGPTVLEFDASGTLTSVSLGSVLEDVCADLSA
jgi:hypothetical protein